MIEHYTGLIEGAVRETNRSGPWCYKKNLRVKRRGRAKKHGKRVNSGLGSRQECETGKGSTAQAGGAAIKSKRECSTEKLSGWGGKRKIDSDLAQR